MARESGEDRPPGKLRPGTDGGRLFVRLFLELVVVFAGVYAAFALSEHQRERDAAERRRQLQAALAQEIEDITVNTRRVAEGLPPDLARFDSLVGAGARPPLQPWIEPVRVQTHMWEATLESGGLDLFDVRTVYDISRFYNALNAGFEQLAQLRELSETILIPNLGHGPDEFYEPGGALRPKYRWYPRGLERLALLAAAITAQGDSLVTRLEPAGPDP